MWAKQMKQTGFTIIELIVVIAVIAILAAVVIIGYGLWRKDIAASSIKSDLTSALSSMESARNFSKDGYPVNLPASFSSSEGVTITYASGTAKGFCIEGTSTSVPGVVYRIDTTQGEKNPVEGKCPLGPVASTPVSKLAGGLGYATATDEATGRIYYTQGNPLSGSSVYVLEPSGGSSLYKTLGTSAIIEDLVVHNGYLYAAAGTVIKRVNLSSGVIDSVTVNGTLNGAQSLYFDGDSTLYIGGTRDFYKLDLTTGTLQSLYYSGSNPYFTGLVKVGNKMYLTGMIYYIYTYDFSTSKMTNTARPSGTADGNLVLLGDKLYTTLDGNLSSYDTATNTWTVIRQVKRVGCAAGGDIELSGERLTYIGFTDLDDTSCANPEHGWSVYSIKP